MKSITCISLLRDCGVFRDFTWPSSLPEFGRYNLIYGWNWTGKTTLSRLFRDLQHRRVPTTGEATLCINGNNVRGEHFIQQNLQVRVFNRDFIDENVFHKEDDIKPVLVLGAKSVEKQKEVKRLKEQLVTTQSNLDSALSEKRSASQYFDQFCKDRAKTIKDTLGSSGQNPYNNYNKSNFKSDAENMRADGGSAHRLTDEQRDGLLARIRAKQKNTADEVAYSLPDLNAITNRLSQLLSTTVISTVIESLKDDPELTDWTRQGLRLHRNRDAKQCQFCERPLPPHRLANLESHFNAEYEQLIQRIGREIDELRHKLEEAKKLSLPHQETLYDEIGEEFQVAQTRLTKTLELVRKFLNNAIQILDDKKSLVFERVNLDLEVPPVNADAVQKLNEVIHKNNQICDNFESKVEEVRKSIANDSIATVLQKFKHHKKAVGDAEAAVNKAQQEVQCLRNEISMIEREIMDHCRPAEELNKDLRQYLGHSELCLEIKETGYMITRGSKPAQQSLSEGERTAIALLYFLQSLQDQRFNLENGVVVLDDPVSSLDANALFLASDFIKGCTKCAGQLFVLTHNFSFFRQIHNWFHHLSGREKKNISQCPARFFMLHSVVENSVRSSVIERLDPLLEQYESEYQYLFAYVYRASRESESQDLEQYYVLPNIARRVLEAFLSFRLPHITGGLRKKLNSVSLDQVKKNRILRFLNTYSHSIAVGAPEHDLTALAEGPSVLKDLLEMIKSLDSNHYSSMMKLVNSEKRNAVGKEKR